MPLTDQVVLEILKAILTVLFLTLGAILSALLWSGWQKRRELQLATAGDFYKCYGEFYEVWKLWNGALKGTTEANPVPIVQPEFLKRAARSEGLLEAILLRLAAEQHLGPKDIEYLGRLRQGYKTLRKAIENNDRLPWSWDESSPYVSFKLLACYIAKRLSSQWRLRLPTHEEAARAWRHITSNKWEHPKWILPKDVLEASKPGDTGEI